ncbi:hypothetical protein FRC01_006813 [Tulasnella sp. 417]|nr:hypothetical protein FRC01_006813 [Tulasnella sp. 417]
MIKDSVRSGGPGGPTKSSSPLSLVQSGGDSSAPESTLSPTANVDNRPPIISKHQGSLGLPEDRPSRSPVPESVLTAARETFSTVQIGSGAIPEIGNFVEVAAEVGLGFVNIIVALDKSDGITEELASHTSRLSTFLKPFNRTSDDVEELNTRLNDLLKELADVQQKVYGWHSLGRLSKVFLQRDNAESLKSFQDTVQTVLEQLQPENSRSSHPVQ